MNRIIGIVSAMILSLLILVPVAAAAEPWDLDEHMLLSTGGDITLEAGQRADLLIVIDGTATIHGDAGAVVVLNGTANFVGATTGGIAAVGSQVTLDSGSVVAGHIRTIDSTVDRATGATIEGTLRDLGPELTDAGILVGAIGFIAYLGFAVMAIFAGLALAGLASRQVRRAEAIISREPLLTIVSSFVGLIAIVAVAVVAMVTVVGIPLGLATLVLVLPVMLIAGYLVAGIWIGDQILARATPGVVRERPYLAAVVGLVILGAVGWIPIVGGVVVLVGFGAVSLLMWRVLRGDKRGVATGQPVPAPMPG